MSLKQYLLETFSFNDRANLVMMEKIQQLPDPSKCIKHLSHLINSQNKWMARIEQDPAAPGMSWWEPLYTAEVLPAEWKKSLERWTNYIEQKTETELFEEKEFIGRDNSLWSAQVADIALQLNYHSIHHRAQIQLFIREQGAEPDFIDYIGTKYKKLTEA